MLLSYIRVYIASGFLPSQMNGIISLSVTFFIFYFFVLRTSKRYVIRTKTMPLAAEVRNT